MPVKKTNVDNDERRRREEQRVKRKANRRRRNKSDREESSSDFHTNANDNDDATTTHHDEEEETELMMEEPMQEEVDHEELHNESAMLKQAVLEHAESLGIDPVAEPELLHIAEESMLAQPPDGWRSLSDDNGNPFYYNEKTKESQWEHPEDEHYRQIVRDLKQAKIAHKATQNATQNATQATPSKGQEQQQSTFGNEKKKDGGGSSEQQNGETWDDWDEEDGDAENDGGHNNDGGSTIVNAGSSRNAPRGGGSSKQEDWEDWDSEEEDDSEVIPTIPIRSGNGSNGVGLPVHTTTTDDTDDDEDDDPPPAPSARPATHLMLKQKSVLSTLVDDSSMSNGSGRGSGSGSGSSGKNITSSNHSSVAKSKRSGDLAKALFHAEAEAKELRAELARVHANAAVQKAEGIRETQQSNARIRILQDEITNERSISSRDSSRVHELTRKVSDLTDERETFKDLYENAIKEKERKPPDSPVSVPLSFCIAIPGIAMIFCTVFPFSFFFFFLYSSRSTLTIFEST
jgi:hypothetical protein